MPPVLPTGHRPAASHREAGFTMIEVLMAMGLALALAASTLVLLQSSFSSAAASTRRALTATEATNAVHRMTHDLRVATAAVVQSPQVLDVVTWQRPVGGGALVPAQVRYDCSVGNACVRYRCSGALIEGNSCPNAASTGTIARGLTNTDVFTPQSDGVPLAVFPASTPASYASPDGLDFVAIRLAVRMDDRDSGPRSAAHARNALEFRDGADLANFDN